MGQARERSEQTLLCSGDTRADVLVPVGKRAWDVVEVKSAANLKDEHLEDVAFQRHVYEGAGLPVRRCYLALVDTGYVRDGEVDPGALSLPCSHLGDASRCTL